MKNYDDHPLMHQGATPKLFEYARKNRETNTEAEKILWEALRLKRLDGFRFRNQHPIGIYIVDFYCHSEKLAIEVDGGYHEIQEQKEYDEGRDIALQIDGIRIIRFKNEQVMNELPKVLEIIRFHLKNGRSNSRQDP